LELYQSLARRMGFTEPCLYSTPEEIVRELLRTPSPLLEGVTWERLVAESAVRLSLPTRPWVTIADGRFPTASVTSELYSVSQYPLKLLTPKEQHFLGSSFANLPKFRQLAGEPVVDLHRDDAEARGIVDGDVVEVRNDRGSCLLRARVSDTVVPGVAVSEVVHWQQHGLDGRNVNWTTPDYLTDLGGNSSYHTNLVEIRPMISGETCE
jgi:anaerobic selenocysteine-containing dehydrogenase